MTTLGRFLDEMNVKFQADFAALEIYQFHGTANELSSRLATWSRPAGVAIRNLDVGDLSSEALNAAVAKATVETALKALSELDGRLLLTVHGLHLLALLYPGGLLQPIIKWLRRDNRVVVLAIPTRQSLKLPESATITDWRTSLANELGPTHTITLGGQ